MDKDFLLSTDTAAELYHKYAAKCPIIDYHCHVSPREIYEDKRFADITEVVIADSVKEIGENAFCQCAGRCLINKN